MKKIKISNHRNIHYEKNRDKLLQKQHNKCTHFKELVRNYIDLENRLKALEENFIHTNRKKFFSKKLDRYILLCKWHFLVTHYANFLKDSKLKNNGTDIFFLVGIYIEK